MRKLLNATAKVAERDVLVGAGLRREAEHALAHDVGLHLVAAAGDAQRRRVQEPPQPHAVVDDVVAPEQPWAPCVSTAASLSAFMYRAKASFMTDASPPGRRPWLSAVWLRYRRKRSSS